MKIIPTFRYELRRYHHAKRDPNFAPAYATVEHAAEVASDYADGAEPGTTVEVWDAQARESIAFFSSGGDLPRGRGGDEDQVPGVPGEPLFRGDTGLAEVREPGLVVRVPDQAVRVLPGPGPGDEHPGGALPRAARIL